MEDGILRGQALHTLILDCDIGWLNDDATALVFAAKSSEIDVLGVTPVAGNFDLSNSVLTALKVLEEIRREDIPVCPGFSRPLLHERSAYADKVWGDWAKQVPMERLPGGLPHKAADRRHAVDFIGETILARPGEVTLVATGPLTNVAVAVRKYPEIVQKVRSVVIMGGNIPVLPRGSGNITPTAEFNFWVDPEAAHVVLRSGMPITLCPLNVCRLTSFRREYYDQIVSVGGPVGSLYEHGLARHFSSLEVDREKPRLFYGLYDSVCIAYLLQPGLFKTLEMNVQVDVRHGPTYGATYGYVRGDYTPGQQTWPLDDGAVRMKVVWDMDFESFADLWLRTILTNQS